MKMVSALQATGSRRSLFVEQMADEVVLREAWYRVQRGGRAGGVDGVTVQAFRPLADRRLQQLHESLLANAYQPSAVRRVQIPKPSGGARVLGLPTIADRIAQTAAALVLNDRVAALFSDRSFAYRPFLGPRRAAILLRTSLPSAGWVVTADIEKFFDNVEHRVLGDQLRNIGIDEGGIRLLVKWLLAPVDDRGRWYQPVKGLPQGSPVAPVLANLYLTGFDSTLEAEGFTHVRYADDFVLVANDEAEARRALRYVSSYLVSRLRLRIKPAKTQLAPTADGFTFVGFRFTRHTWTIPAESMDRFKETVTGFLTSAPPRTLADMAKSHNDLIRGWRHYYGGNSSEMDRQLTELDSWRSSECAAYLERDGKDPDAAAVWFEHLLGYEENHMPAGTYATPLETEEARADPPSDRPDEWHRGAGAGDARRETRVFSTVREARDAHISRQQLPVLLEGGWLRVPTFGGFVTKSHALVVVRRRKQTIFECAFDDVTCLTVEANGVALSTTVIDECARRGIAIAVCRVSGKPIARVVSARSPLDHSVVLLQLKARAAKSGTPLVQALLSAKLANQRALLLYHSKYRRRDPSVRARLIEAARGIERHLGELNRVSGPMRKVRRQIFLTEARAAAHYWEAFSALVPAHMGFRHRVHRGADDVVNMALNYGYAQLLSRVWVAVHRAGLEPSLGLLHTGRRRSAGLVFDLMEPFRQPAVDKVVLGLLGRGAKLEMNDTHELTLRTRALLQQALARRLAPTGTEPSSNLLLHIQRRTIAFRRALVDGRPYAPYRMSW